MQNYDEAVKALPTFMRAHLGRGVALQGLGRQQVKGHHLPVCPTQLISVDS